MGVDGRGDSYVGVTEELLDDGELDALLAEECRSRGAEIVKPDPGVLLG